jgi:hypothetical protein
LHEASLVVFRQISPANVSKFGRQKEILIKIQQKADYLTEKVIGFFVVL